MKLRKLFSFAPSVDALLDPGGTQPQAIRIQAARVQIVLLWLGILLLAGLVGTLLFFRELEISRGYQSRILELEIADKLRSMNKESEKLEKSKKTELERVKAATAAVPAKKVQVKKVIAKPIKKVAEVGAIISHFNGSCQANRCDVQLRLMPGKIGTARGKLLVVLETEIKRIGGPSELVPIRKRYVVFPGYQRLDVVDEKLLRTKAGNQFQFSKALQPSVGFELRTEEIPLRALAFVYDRNNRLNSKKSLSLTPEIVP